MGAECPNGHGRQNIIVMITADASNPNKASDVVAWKLECGCVVGGESYAAFQKAASAAELVRADAVRKADTEAQKSKAAAYAAFVLSEGK